MIELLFYALSGGFFSLVGGLLLLWKSKLAHQLMTPLIAFGAGAFLAAVFTDILPEAIEMVDEPHPILWATLGGFLTFFALERLFMTQFKHFRHSHQSHSDHTEPLPFLLILGDSLHNFLDGIVIALAFVANPVLGLPTALAIAAHEIPQEIGDFSVLMNMGWKKHKILAVNVMQSLLTLPGMAVGLLLGHQIESHLPLLLGATAGIFLYIAGSDLIPELHHRSEHKHFLRVLIPMLLSVFLVAFLSQLAHGK